MTARRVCVLYTGGTIGTRHLNQELLVGEPELFQMQEIEDLLTERSNLDSSSVYIDFHELESTKGGPFAPVVSSAISPRDWSDMAFQIRRIYADYDGFVVLHGTDTMAWTASALSFMFSNLGKPVVLTGSQKPILATPSDAVSNFVDSVILASGGPDVPTIPEVVICFAGQILRGNRAQKISASSMRGFDTPNFPRLGRIGRRIDVDVSRLRAAPSQTDAFFVDEIDAATVADVMIYPGMTDGHLKACLEGHDGALLRTFGAGNIDSSLLKVIQGRAARDMLLINVTQCPEGLVESRMLSGSSRLADCGVVSGLDMTNEAALTKMKVLLGRGPVEVAREQMQLDLRGEQSMDLVEYHTNSRLSTNGSVHRVALASALHARVDPARVASAVLRIDGPEKSASKSDLALSAVWLNHWKAEEDDRESDSDPRLVRSQREAPPGGTRVSSLTFDVTHQVRRVCEPGGPVSLTLVTAKPQSALCVRLSIFTQHRPDAVL